MFTALVMSALSATALVQQTDTIVQTNGASRLELESFQGEVVVRTWDRDAVQIRAEHQDGISIEIDRSGNSISVEPDLERGGHVHQPIEFDVTVPVAFDLILEGVALSVDVRGTEGQVEVTTVHGPVTVYGGRGNITLESVNGPVYLEGAHGDIEVIGVAGGVTMVNCSGDISAQSVGGPLSLEGVTSPDVEVGTVGGTLQYQGSIEDGGRYNFGSHGGDIWLRLPPGIDAEFEILALSGSVEVEYPGAPAEAEAGKGIPGLMGKSLRFELGTGSARIEIETFGGKVHILGSGG
jgi:hypothetical protein